MPIGGKTKKQNRLWLARKRRSLRQKQVAYLLNHYTADQVSRYEKGTRMPTLETALMLEIIYGVPLRVLFKEQYEELQIEVRRKIEANPSLKHIKDIEEAGHRDSKQFCTYEDTANIPAVSQAELVPVYRHIAKLSKKLAYLR